MTPLGALLMRRIAAEGPIRLSDYMESCLMHPAHGYYTQRTPFGAAGDFITAPEISQMFGEMIGLCLASQWMEMGAPSPVALAELGPGRGTLMADILRATRGVRGFHQAARLHLVEASPALREVQRGALAPAEVVWHDGVDSLPELPLLLVANEFLDALPIRQFTRQGAAWRETMIGMAQGALVRGLAPPAWPEVLAGRGALPEGTIVEHCPALGPVVGSVAGRIARQGGLALFIDYGGWQGTGDTLQAVRRHEPVDPLAEPGLADLTAHVDFAEVAAHARPLAHRYAAQGRFLLSLGMAERAAVLARGLTGERARQHAAAFHRLTDPAEMGNLFKVIALFPGNGPTPWGFHDA